jgi:hypothetical protein
MDELAFGIEPNFAANITPSLAEGEILADIDAGFFVDHAIKQRIVLIGLGV